MCAVASGSWGGLCLSMGVIGRYVTVTGPTDGPPAPGGCLKLPMFPWLER